MLSQGLAWGRIWSGWGYAKEKIHEADWFATVKLDEGLTIHVLPARHYSGRLLIRNRTLWAAYALETSTRRIFFSGNSGYGPRFLEIGRRFKGFDMAVLDTGQYDRRWAYIHMNPEEAVRAASDLQARNPDDYKKTVEQARRERDSGYKPPLKAAVPDMDDYTTVFLGFPIWGETAPPVIRSFLADHDLSGKTLIPFITHGGYGLGNSLSVLAAHAPRARLLDAGLTLQADQERQTLERVTRWLGEIRAKGQAAG